MSFLLISDYYPRALLSLGYALKHRVMRQLGMRTVGATSHFMCRHYFPDSLHGTINDGIICKKNDINARWKNKMGDHLHPVVLNQFLRLTRTTDRRR